MSWPQEAYLYLRQIVTPKSRPQTGGNFLYTKSDNELYLLDADGTEHAVGGGGGGGGGGFDRRWNVGPAETSYDEFNDASLAAGWSRVDTAGHTGYVAWTEAADVLSVATGLGTDAAAELHGMVQPLTSLGGSVATGDAFVTRVSNFTTAARTLGGLVLADGTTVGAGNQILCSLDSGSTNPTPVTHIMSNWNARSSFTSLLAIYGPAVYLRMAKLSGTNWRLDYSPDGVSWISGTTFPNTFTPTHVGFAASSWGTSTKGVMSFDFLRRVSGIT